MDKTLSLETNMQIALRNGFKLRKKFAKECIGLLFVEADKELAIILEKYDLSEIILNKDYEKMNPLMREVREVFNMDAKNILDLMHSSRVLDNKFVRIQLGSKSFESYIEVMPDVVPPELVPDMLFLEYSKMINPWSNSIPEEYHLLPDEVYLFQQFFKDNFKKLTVKSYNTRIKKTSYTSKLLSYKDIEISLSERLDGYKELIKRVEKISPNETILIKNVLIGIFVKGEQFLYDSSQNAAFYNKKLA